MAEDVRIPRVVRKKTSIWLDQYLWDRFVVWTHDRRTSTCHVLEPIIYALLEGSQKLEFSAIPNLEMNLNVTREVQRPRRATGKATEEPLWEDWGDHLRCYFCKRPSRWVVYYSPGWDKSIRVYTCGHHVHRYHRMISSAQGWPKISFQALNM